MTRLCKCDCYYEGRAEILKETIEFVEVRKRALIKQLKAQETKK